MSLIGKYCGFEGFEPDGNQWDCVGTVIEKYRGKVIDYYIVKITNYDFMHVPCSSFLHFLEE